MEEIEKMKLNKSIVEIQNKIINYVRNSAIVERSHRKDQERFYYKSQEESLFAI